MDAWQDGEEFVIQMDIPGVDPDSIDLDVPDLGADEVAQDRGSFGPIGPSRADSAR